MPSPFRFVPNLPLTIVVLSWGFNFVALKVLYEELTPPALALVRFAVMYVLLVAICLWRGESLRYRGREGLQVLLVGFVAMGVYMLLFLEGLEGTSPAEGAIVLASAPVFTYLFASALKQERFSWVALVGAVVAFFGVMIVILGGAAVGRGTVEGNLTVLVSAVVWALSVVMMRPLLANYSPLQLLTLSMPGGLVVLIPWGIVPLLEADLAAISPFGWAMFAQIAVLSGVIAFTCFYEGIRQVGAAVATLYQFFVPPTAAFFAWIVMGKSLAPIQFLGLIVVIIGVYVASRARMAAPGAVVVSDSK